MILSILQHTPAWVFAIFVLLVWLGVRRLRSHDVPVRRLLILPLAMGAFSLFGLGSAFGFGATTLATWACAYLFVLAVAQRLPARRDVAYSAANNTVRVPGSWLPLALMMVIFFLRYAVAVLLAIDPSLRADTLFVIGIAALYGSTSACFAARTLRVWRSRQPAAAVGPGLAA